MGNGVDLSKVEHRTGVDDIDPLQPDVPQERQVGALEAMAANDILGEAGSVDRDTGRVEAAAPETNAAREAAEQDYAGTPPAHTPGMGQSRSQAVGR